MKKGLVFKLFILIVLVIFAVIYLGIFNNLIGKAISNENSQTHTIGPSESEISCMSNCMKCTSPGVDCTGNQEQCTAQCNLKKPEATKETSCMEKCVVTGCGEFDFACQTQNQNKCEKECEMIKEPEAKSEEEQCIRECVKKVDPNLICQAEEGGEKGNEVCQKCAQECLYLYAGPCLSDEKIKAKEKECQTCEHCYGKPIMGDSGEGYNCIVDIECADASTEFGDSPGSGEGIQEKTEEGIVAKVGNAVGNVFEAIGDFFTGIFSSKPEEQNSQ